MIEIFSQEKLQKAIDCCMRQMDSVVKEFNYGKKFQASNSVNDFYPHSGNVEWTTGFCTGEYWLAYELSAKEDFKTAALTQVDSFLNRIIQRVDVDHHDMGFLYTPSCVAAYKLTQSETGKKAALLAAEHLLYRFQPKGRFIQAWGKLGAPKNYRLIIDCLLNLPLLYWATEITGDEKYRRVALAHSKTSLANLIRPDNSTYHTFFFNPETGEPTHGTTQQGYKDGSAWARGQAWGIYGLALAYLYTQDNKCIDLFYNVTDYFIGRLPKDHVPYWDLTFVDGNEPRDSSAAAIAACGMLEMAKHLPLEKATQYAAVAQRIAESLAENYATKNPKESNGLLLHGVYAKKSPYNPIPDDRGVDECNTWGDYFYLELLIRLQKDWALYW